MKASSRDERIWLAVGSLVILALAAGGFILWYTQAVMVPFVLAVFIAIVVSPVVDDLVVRRHIPQSLAVFAAILVVLGILASSVPFVIYAVQEVAAEADDYGGKFNAMADRVLDQFEKWHMPIDEAKVTSAIRKSLPAWAGQTVDKVARVLTNGFLILVFVIFLLAGRNPYRIREGIYAEIESKIRSYIATKFTVSAVTGILVWMILSLFGLKLAVLFGMTAFLLNFIPSVGSVISTLLPLPLALAQFSNPWMVVGVVAVPGVVQNVIGNAIEPKLMGKGLELHPVTILLALAFWGLLWGLVGMVLAVPMVASIRIVLVRFDTTRALGNLLAGELPGGDAAAGRRQGDRNAAAHARRWLPKKPRQPQVFRSRR